MPQQPLLPQQPAPQQPAANDLLEAVIASTSPYTTAAAKAQQQQQSRNNSFDTPESLQAAIQEQQAERLAQQPQQPAPQEPQPQQQPAPQQPAPQEPPQSQTPAPQEPAGEDAETARQTARQRELNEIKANERDPVFETDLHNSLRPLSAAQIAQRDSIEVEEAQRIVQQQALENDAMIRQIVDTKNMLARDEKRVELEFPVLDRQSEHHVSDLRRAFDDLYFSKFQSPQRDNTTNQIYRANSPYELAKAMAQAFDLGKQQGNDEGVAQGAESQRAAFSQAPPTRPTASPTQQPAGQQQRPMDLGDQLLAEVDRQINRVGY